MEKPTVVDKRSVRLENISKKDYIPFLGGRPRREKIITPDEILNLKIALHTTTTVNEFLGQETI